MTILVKSKKILILSLFLFGIFFMGLNVGAWVNDTSVDSFDFSCTGYGTGTVDCSETGKNGPYQVYRWDYQEMSSDQVNVFFDVCFIGSNRCKHIEYKTGLGGSEYDGLSPEDTSNYTGVEIRSFSMNPTPENDSLDSSEKTFRGSITFKSRSPDPAPTGTVCVTSNVTTHVNVTGATNLSADIAGGTTSCAPGVATGSYSADGSILSGYTGPTYNANPQTLTAGATITFALTYTAISGGGGGTPVCGNGIVESGEQCDNGANNGTCNEHLCSTSCTNNTCGATTGTIEVRALCNGALVNNVPLTISYMLPSGASGNYGLTATAVLPFADPGSYWAGYVSGMPTGCTTFSNITPGWNTTYNASNQTLTAGGYIVFNYNFTSPAPTLSLSCSPNPVTYNSAGTLTWSSTNVSANSCSITPSSKVSGSSTGLPASGSKFTTALTADVSYAINCQGTNGSSIQRTATCDAGLAPAPTVTLTASPNPVSYNTNTTLTWSPTNASSCTVSSSPSVSGWSGSKSASGGSESVGPLTAPTTFSITCSGAGGSDSDSVTVNVSSPPAPTCSLSSSPATVSYGSSSTLTWSVPNSATSYPSSCTASGDWSGTKTISGTQSTGALTSNKTYNVTCTGLGGTSSTCSTTVGVSAPTVTLTASPNPVSYNTNTTLTWSPTNASSCTVSSSPSVSGWSGSKSASGGSESVGPLTAPTTFSITCSGNGSASASVTVNVTPPSVPTVTLTASPNPVIYNTGSTLTWTPSGSYISSCTATGDWSGGKSVSGGTESTGNLTSTKTYSIYCTNPGGNGPTASVTVNVGAAPSMNYFRCQGESGPAVNTDGTCTIGYGDDVDILWSSSNTTGCSLVARNASSGSVISDDYVASSGSREDDNITASRNYEIECWNNISGVHAPALPLPLHVVVSAPTADIEANGSDVPITLPWNSSATLSWSSTNAGSCTASGDWSGSKPTSGSQGTGNLTVPKTYNFTLTCSGNGNSAPDTVQIIISPPVPNSPSGVTVTQPNYCVSGPAATTTWTYSDPAGSPQTAYEIEIDDVPSFNSPEVDTGKVMSNSTSYFSGQGLLAFNKTYKARVRVWNGYDVVSGWTESSSFRTPNFAYPQVNFTWTANNISENPSPPLGKVVQFTDQTGFSSQSNPNSHEWDWTFGDGTSSDNQNPSKTYNTEGSYYVTLTATDSQNQSCSRTRGPLIIQKPIPKWREVAPK